MHENKKRNPLFSLPLSRILRRSCPGVLLLLAIPLLGLLPRPFQIGMANQPEWVIEVQRRLPVPATVSSPAVSPEAPDQRAPDDGSAAR